MEAKLNRIQEEGANAFWDDIYFHENPYPEMPPGWQAEDWEEDIALENQAWGNGWNLEDKRLCRLWIEVKKERENE